MALNVAAQKGHLEVLRELLSHGADMNIAKGNGMTPINAASQNSHIKVVRKLLYRCNCVDNCCNLLSVAAKNGNVEVFHEFLKHRVFVIAATNTYSELLNVAAKNGHVDIIRDLLKVGASVPCSESHGWTPIITAAKNGHMEVVRLLLYHVDNEGR
jgi:ankyrin repeat protein